MKDAISANPNLSSPIELDPGSDGGELAQDRRFVLSQSEGSRCRPRSAISRGAAIACWLWLAGWLAVSMACRRSAPAGPDDQARLGDGPKQYSARLVRTVEEDGRTETVESQITVDGQMTREDWTEHGEKRALIIRPDLGETYLLFLDKGEFVVQGLDQGSAYKGSAPADQGNAGVEPPGGGRSVPFVDPLAVESDMSSPANQANSNNVVLPDAAFDNHPCKAFEQRAIFPDGTTDITRTYRATDLFGMIIRTESESNGKAGHLRVITERRDIQTSILQALFEIPAGFRRKSG